MIHFKTGLPWAAWLVVGLAAALVLGVSKAWLALLVVAVLGLWYVPFGTAINLVVITLLLWPMRVAATSV